MWALLLALVFTLVCADQESPSDLKPSEKPRVGGSEEKSCVCACVFVCAHVCIYVCHFGVSGCIRFNQNLSPDIVLCINDTCIIHYSGLYYFNLI